MLTPHHLPVRVAVQWDESSGRKHLIDLVLAEAPGAVPGLYDACVPVRPTGCGYGTFIRFPSVAKSCTGCPHAAVVLDLSFVGGHYYACLLPCDIPFDKLYEHAVQQATYSEIEMRVHVGESAVPHTPGAPFHLQDGDVVTFQRPPQEWHPRQLVSELLADKASWSPPAGLPSTGGATGLLVQHRQERIFMPVHHHHGQSSVAAIQTLWDYEPGGCTVCAFPTPDLEFRVTTCFLYRVHNLVTRQTFAVEMSLPFVTLGGLAIVFGLYTLPFTLSTSPLIPPRHTKETCRIWHARPR